MAATTALLTEELAAVITNAVMDGCSMDDAAGAAGVNRASLYRWQKRGREARAARELGEEAIPEDEPYIAFTEGLETARFKSKVEAIHMWRKAILGWDHEETTTITMPDGTVKTTVKKGHRFDYRAVVEWLERRYPKEFGRIIRQEISGPDGQAIPVEERVTSIVGEVEAFLRAEADAAPADGTPAEES